MYTRYQGQYSQLEAIILRLRNPCEKVILMLVGSDLIHPYFVLQSPHSAMRLSH